MVFSGVEVYRIFFILILYDYIGFILYMKIIIFFLYFIKFFGNEKYNKFFKKFYNEDKLY